MTLTVGVSVTGHAHAYGTGSQILYGLENAGKRSLDSERIRTYNGASESVDIVFSRKY